MVAPPLELVVASRSAAALNALQEMAGEFHTRFVSCSSMNDLLAELARSQSHIAVIDAELCDLGGIGAVRSVRVLAPDCEVILTSIDPISPGGLEAIRAGALECVMPADATMRVRAHVARLAGRLRQASYLLEVLGRSGRQADGRRYEVGQM